MPRDTRKLGTALPNTKVDVAYILGMLIFMMPIAVLIGFGSKQVAARSPRSWTWLKIACQSVLLSACLIGFIVALDVFRSGQDMMGLTLLFLPITAMGVFARGRWLEILLGCLRAHGQERDLSDRL
jgi:hypothetical protein